jgi:hypothetical protein
VALAAEKAERDRADRFKDLEIQAESAVKIEEAKEAAARNASLEAQDWAKKEEVAVAVAQTRLEEAHAQEERQLDHMHAAEERANISRTVAEGALAQLQVCNGNNVYYIYATCCKWWTLWCPQAHFGAPRLKILTAPSPSLNPEF